MDVHYGLAIEYKGAGIPPWHHPRILSGLGGVCINSICHYKKRDAMQCPARVGPWNFALEYCL